MAYIVMADVVMAHVVMAYIVTTYAVMAHVVMAHVARHPHRVTGSDVERTADGAADVGVAVAAAPPKGLYLAVWAITIVGHNYNGL